MARCVAVLGASGVGKSTLVNRLASLEASAQTVSAPSHGLRIVPFSYLGERWTALDCPGSLEFLQDSRDALAAADAAVICVSPDPEQAVLAAPYLRAAEEAGAPVILYVNRIDEALARVRDIVSALQDYAGHAIVLRQVPIREEGAVIGSVDLVSERAWRYRNGQSSALIEIPSGVLDREQEARDEMLETLSELDDWLLEEIVEDRTPAEGPLYAICARTMRENQAIPALIGAAEQGSGVRRLMKALRHEAPTPEATRVRLTEAADMGPDALLAVAFDARHRRHVGKTVTIRSFADGVKTGAMLDGATLGMLSDPAAEKPSALGVLEAGEIAAAVKSDHLQRGRVYAADHAADGPEWRAPLTPLMSRALHPKSDRDEAKLSEALAKLAEDDPALRVSQDEETGAHVVGCQGALHLRAAQEILAEVFGVETTADAVGGGYRETITRAVDTHYRHKKQSGGAGQFADVKLQVAPAARGDGFAFSETVKGGAVPRNYIPAVEAGARDALTRGPLGFPVLDVAVTLTDGQHHSVDSSDMAFRIAGRMGVQEALAEAAPVLLEPVYAVSLLAPSVFTGALTQIVGAHHGQVLGFERDPVARGWDVFRALLPMSAMDELIRELRAATQGVGRFEAVFDHYDERYGKEADKIVEARRQEVGQRGGH